MHAPSGEKRDLQNRGRGSDSLRVLHASAARWTEQSSPTRTVGGSNPPGCTMLSRADRDSEFLPLMTGIDTRRLHHVPARGLRPEFPKLGERVRLPSVTPWSGRLLVTATGFSHRRSRVRFPPRSPLASCTSSCHYSTNTPIGPLADAFSRSVLRSHADLLLIQFESARTLLLGSAARV